MMIIYQFTSGSIAEDDSPQPPRNTSLSVDLDVTIGTHSSWLSLGRWGNNGSKLIVEESRKERRR
ncbi:hypothetical protein BVRB_1g011560 [Beta vulgaris subsp. vulgaris]|nr:hypothetical protein BVRB_1g011560 [Beta vulgaris subsp. vulgaris]